MIYLIPKVIALSLLSLTALALEAPVSSPLELRERVSSVNKVGLEFIQKLIKVDLQESKPLKNTMVSPISFYSAFALLHGGLREKTKTNLESFLAAPSASIAEFDSQNGALLKKLQMDRVPEAEQPTRGPKLPVLGFGNSAWATRGFNFAPAYSENLKSFYSAEVTESLEFADPKTADVINAWAEKKTNGLIPQVINHDIIKDAYWLLMNAVYLEASWDVKFEKLAAAAAPEFSLLDGKKVAVDMIQGGKRLNYLENNEYQAAEIPFFGADISFFVILPRSTQQFVTWMENGSFFEQEQWNTVLNAFAIAAAHPREFFVNLKMPKFSFPFSRTFVKDDPLTESLGLGFLFDKANRPDFMPMGIPRVAGLIKQDTKIELDEFGVKAAAVTAIISEPRSGGGPRYTKDMVVDKPFIFAIVSKSTNTLLFVGTVVDPTMH